MKILITGAAGFIGFHLVKRLAGAGHTLVGLDNINDYYDVNLKYGRLQELGIGREAIEKMQASGQTGKEAVEERRDAGKEGKENIKEIRASGKTGKADGDKVRDPGKEGGKGGARREDREEKTPLPYICSNLYPDFKFIKADLTDLSLLRRMMEENRFDKVCNLAAQAGVRYSFENPYSYIQSNIVGFHNLLDLSSRLGTKHFIYASSSSVYGNNAQVPFRESDRVDEPQSLYAATKKSNELMAYVYSNQLGLPTTGLRFFTVYGPWGRPDMAPFLFLKSILEGKEIRIFNHGDLSRDFSYIDDIVTGVIKVIESVPPDTHACKIYNIGNSRPVRLMDFIHTLERAAGKEAVKKYVGMQQGDVYQTYANTASIENDFNFKPGTPLERGISEFCKWYRKYYRL